MTTLTISIPLIDSKYFNKDKSDFNISLFDLNGKRLMQEEVINKKLTIDMSKYNSSVYILKIEQECKIIATYQVIKK